MFDPSGELAWKKSSLADVPEDDAVYVERIGDAPVVEMESGYLLLLDPEGRLLQKSDAVSPVNVVARGLDDYIAVAAKGGVYLFKYKEPRSARLTISLPGELFSVTVDGEEVELLLAPGSRSPSAPELVEHGSLGIGSRSGATGSRTPAA